MTQETVADMTAPQGAIWQAWLDAFIHPKFETYARWYPRMGQRWRGISLVTSVLLIIMTGIVYLGLHAFVAPRSVEMMSFTTYYAYFHSSDGIRRAVFNTASSVALIFAIPALVTLISPRSLGPYRIRFKRVNRPWMQVQPVICMLLLCSALTDFAFGFFLQTSGILDFVEFMLVTWLTLYTWTLTYESLAAGSSRTKFQAGLVAAIPGLLVYFLPGLFGHPLW